MNTPLDWAIRRCCYRDAVPDERCPLPGEWWIWAEGANGVISACTAHLGPVIAEGRAGDMGKGWHIYEIQPDVEAP